MSFDYFNNDDVTRMVLLWVCYSNKAFGLCLLLQLFVCCCSCVVNMNDCFVSKNVEDLSVTLRLKVYLAPSLVKNECVRVCQ